MFDQPEALSTTLCLLFDHTLILEQIQVRVYITRQAVTVVVKLQLVQEVVSVESEPSTLRNPRIVDACYASFCVSLC